MTYENATFTARLPETEVVGPYSPWPRREARTTRNPLKRPVAAAAVVAGVAVFAHCAGPLMS